MTTPYFPNEEYGIYEQDYVRYVSSPLDASVSSEIRRFSLFTPDDQAIYRQSLSREHRQLLAIFSTRRSVSSLRDRSLNAARDALAALLVPELWNPEPFTDLKLALFALRELGVELDAVDQYLSFSPSPRGEAMLWSGIDAIGRVQDMVDFGIRRVTTSEGVGFLEIPEEQLQVGVGWQGLAPVLGARKMSYDPRVNLAAIALTLSTAMEAGGAWTARPMYVSTLAGGFFHGDDAGWTVPTTGCLSFSLGRNDDEVDPVDVWVAEIADGELLADLESDLSSVQGEEPLAVMARRGSVVIVITLTPTFDEYDQFEDAEDGFVDDEDADLVDGHGDEPTGSPIDLVALREIAAEILGAASA